MAHREHWQVTDPAEFQRRGISDIEAFRAVRDQVRLRVETLIRTL
jgi:hypothetical protein